MKSPSTAFADNIVLPKNVLDNSRKLICKLLPSFSSLKHIFVFSPHFDDAVLSAGSLLAYVSQRVKINVVNVFTAGSPISTPLTKKLLQQAAYTNAKDYFTGRDKEDKKALSLLGNIERFNLGFVDAAWRQTNAKLPLYPHTTLDIFRKEDEVLKQQLITTFSPLGIDSNNTAIFAPLGRGRNRDHLLVRDACMEIFPTCIFYLDFPYSHQYPDAEKEFVQTRKLKLLEWNGNNYTQKAKAIIHYKTQAKSLFENGPLTLPLETFYTHPFTSL